MLHVHLQKSTKSVDTPSLFKNNAQAAQERKFLHCRVHESILHGNEHGCHHHRTTVLRMGRPRFCGRCPCLGAQPARRVAVYPKAGGDDETCRQQATARLGAADTQPTAGGCLVRTPVGWPIKFGGATGALGTGIPLGMFSARAAQYPPAPPALGTHPFS